VRRRALLVALTAFALVAACEDGGDGDAGNTPSAEPTRDRVATFELTSPAFDDDAPIPDGFTCQGANASPPLRWSGVPDDAVELALIVEDPDAPTPEPFVHWVAWGIDPAASQLPEATVPAGVIQGSNQAGQAGYAGPCPPRGDDPHRYEFTLVALAEPLDLAGGATASDVRAAIEGDTLAEATLTGTYARP
jgi:Raf kinase inhibitor-like YbhB/YbcL family protein